jgi:hypothetical protein
MANQRGIKAHSLTYQRLTTSWIVMITSDVRGTSREFSNLANSISTKMKQGIGALPVLTLDYRFVGATHVRKVKLTDA